MKLLFCTVAVLFPLSAFAVNDMGKEISCDPWEGKSPKSLEKSINVIINDAYSSGKESSAKGDGKIIVAKRSKQDTCFVAFEYYDDLNRKKLNCRQYIDMCEVTNAQLQAQKEDEAREKAKPQMCITPADSYRK